MTEERNCIDRYEIREIVGRGAMGVVYRAVDPVIGRVVALKTICSMDDPFHSEPGEDCVERFAREARAAGLLSHPNIVTIYDVGQMADTGISYIAMEFVEGTTLRQLIPHGGVMAPDRVVDVGLQVARALDYAHRRNIVHRDVKPANILIRDDGLIKLTDFGVARMGISDLTRTGESVGSPSYIAPEMLLDQPVDGRADLFSLGVVFYELLTGVKPFTGETLAALYHKILAVTPAIPSSLNAAIPPEWDAIIMKLLARQPSDRYAGAHQLIDDLRALEQGGALRHAMDETRVTGSFTQAGSRGVRETDLERVIEEGAGDGPRGPRVSFPAHMKALLALATIAGFAVTIILATILFRETPAKAATAQPRPEASRNASAQPAPADLTVRLAHNLKAAVLTIQVDGKTLLEEPIQGTRSKMRIQGIFSRHVPIAAGKHVFTVSVQEEGGKRWNTATTRRLQPDGEATLFIEVKGVLRKSLDVTWY